MNKNHNNQQHLDKTHQALSHLLLSYDLDYNEFCHLLKRQYVLDAYKQCQTVTRTALRTGVDRRFVSKIIKGKKLYVKPSPLLTILNRLSKIGKKNNGLINKNGRNSLESIISQVANGATTTQSAFDELIMLGCIVDTEHKIKLVKTDFNLNRTQIYLLDKFSESILKYANYATVISPTLKY